MIITRNGRSLKHVISLKILLLRSMRLSSFPSQFTVPKASAFQMFAVSEAPRLQPKKVFHLRHFHVTQQCTADVLLK